MQKILKIDKWNDSYYIQSLQRQQYKRDISKSIEPVVLQNRLISPQPKNLCKSLSEWAGELRCTIQNIHCAGHKNNCAPRLAKVFNHAIFIFMALENYQFAREICYSQIQLFTKWSNKTNNINFLKYVFQPWLYLIQLSRLEGNIYDAFNKLNTLNLTKQPDVMMGDNKILTQLLYQSLHQDIELFNEIISQSIIERIKLCFESQRYSEFIAFMEDKHIAFSGVHDVIIQEANAIAYANMGKIHEAFRIIGCSRSNNNPAKHPVLLLRELEMRLSCGPDSEAVNALVLLSDSFLQNPNIITINQIDYILHAVYVMKMAKLTDIAIKLAYSGLEASTKLGDEVSKADCLMVLYDLLDNPEKRKNIEDLMITLYFNTQYVAVRKHMLHVFNDLKYVENKYHYDVMTPLFEDVLAFETLF